VRETLLLWVCLHLLFPGADHFDTNPMACSSHESHSVRKQHTVFTPKFRAEPQNAIFRTRAPTPCFPPILMQNHSRQVGYLFLNASMVVFASQLHMEMVEKHCTIDKIQTFGIFNISGNSFASPSHRTHSQKMQQKHKIHAHIVITLNFNEFRTHTKFNCIYRVQ